MPNNIDFKRLIKSNIQSFSSGDLKENAFNLFSTLGYESDKKVELNPNTVEGFKDFLDENSQSFKNEKKAYLDEWETVDFLFQLSDEEVSKIKSLFDSNKVDTSSESYKSYLFFAIKLKQEEYRRSQLAEITREVNRIFPMPVMILFQHGETLTFSVVDRRLHKLDSSKDVVEIKKVSLIKDIRIEKTHRAHIEILSDLALQNYDVRNFVELHEAWKKTLDTKELNKSFFQKLANWYFWAVNEVTFPVGDESETEEVRNATSIIRLITRLMFVWFLKEKGLVSDKLFDEDYLREILKFNDDSTFYKAILQNLFFATLNSEMGKRDFINDSFQGKNGQHFVHNVFRYKDKFVTPDETIKELFEPIPFLNGGLFECLDKEIEVEGSKKKKKVRVDGFSQHKSNPLSVPDELFFGEEQNVDLNDVFGTTNKTYKVRGLINLLNGYKFTVTENTPIEEEIALDPELLGKVFENLLANYNPETKTTARKQTGSFYTPREIVNYMVDESLIAYLKSKLETETEGFSGFIAFGENQATLYGNEARIQPKFEETISGNRWHGKSEKLETALRELFSYSEELHEFNETETEILIKAIDNCKILDPACGSGAFPMGVLLKLVHILEKLDTDNEKWKEWQRRKAVRETEEAYKIGDHKEREDRLLEINKIFEENSSDYGRKLFLIENCIYGVDIQPIAIQIAKLRFFISLIVDQIATDDIPNNRGIRPLPNLETKFVAANTLIGLETNGGLKPVGVPELEAELKEVRAKHFNARTRRTKEKYRKRDLEIRTEIADLLKQTIGFNETSANQITKWNPYDQNFTAEWFDAEWMFGIEKGFDIVIGNPPYVNAKTMQANYPSLRTYLKNSYNYLTDKWDIYIAFMELALKIGSDTSSTIFIIPNSFVSENYSKKIRKHLISDKLVKKVAFYEYDIFDAAVKNIVILISNIKSQKFERLIYKTPDLFETKNVEIESIFKSSDSKLFKYIDQEINLGDVCFISVGMVLNANEKLAKGEFTKSDLISKTKDAIFCRRYTEGKWIDKYQIREINYLEWNTDRVPSKIRRETFPELYENNKILTNKIGEIKAVYDESNIYCDQTNRVLVKYIDLKEVKNRSITNSIKKFSNKDRKLLERISENYNLKYIVGLLNSKFYLHLLDLLRTKESFDLNPLVLRKLPIPITTEEEQQTEIAEIVDKIIEAKKQDANADTNELEDEIDCLVYQLYGLDEDEIAIVEGRESKK